MPSWVNQLCSSNKHPTSVFTNLFFSNLLIFFSDKFFPCLLSGVNGTSSPLLSDPELYPLSACACACPCGSDCRSAKVGGDERT